VYIPRHWHYAISLFISLLGFYIKQRFGNTYDVVIVFLVLQYHAVIHSLYIFKAGVMYQAYVTKAEPKAEPVYDHDTGAMVDETPIQSDPGFITLARKPVSTVPVLLNQVVTLPRFDKERNFAITLWRQHDAGFPANLTESKWVKAGKFSHDEFAAMMDNWEGYGVSGREGKKRKRVILDWRKVRLVAEGNSLPSPPR